MRINSNEQNMFKKSKHDIQLGIFSSPSNLLTGTSKKLYEDDLAWHNIFRQQVTMRIDESIFSELYCSNNGTPNASIRVLVAMMIIKEGLGISDEKLYEDCRFNILTHSAIGLLNMDDQVPVESTYYLFRKRIRDYALKYNVNLFKKAFTQITKGQCLEFMVSGISIRMDSKLLGSNIAWLSRYELVHETLRLFYKEIKKINILDKKTEEKLDELLKFEGNKVIYTHTTEEVKEKLQILGALIYEILPLFSSYNCKHYETLKNVFDQQFVVGTDKIVIARKKEDVSAKSIQSPHDTDCDFRDKDGNKIKGYTDNLIESCDDTGLNLICDVATAVASTSDVTFVEDGINRSQEVLTDKIQNVHADGAYHSPSNQEYCKKNKMNFYLHAMQGAKGRYTYTIMDNGELIVFDTKENQSIKARKILCKNNVTKWRIQTAKGYRYITQKEIDAYFTRKRIEETPIEILQKRNNVEATIFQFGYHYSNDKSKYRGIIKHEMWANIRCSWINFVRILNHIRKLCKVGSFLSINGLLNSISCLKLVVKIILQVFFANKLTFDIK